MCLKPQSHEASKLQTVQIVLQSCFGLFRFAMMSGRPCGPVLLQTFCFFVDRDRLFSWEEKGISGRNDFGLAFA